VSLWASTLPCLSKQQESITPSRPSMSMFGMAFVKSHNSVITAGNDMCIRWWDLNCQTDSYILANPEKPEQPITGPSVKHGDFRFRLVDGVEVIHDTTGSVQNAIGQGKKADLDAGSIGSSGSSTSSTSTGHTYHHSNAHHNVITDLATIATPNQSFIISASADGVIKVWK
jgi:WD40 repeat protein